MKSLFTYFSSNPREIEVDRQSNLATQDVKNVQEISPLSSQRILQEPDLQSRSSSSARHLVQKLDSLQQPSAPIQCQETFNENELQSPYFKLESFSPEVGQSANHQSSFHKFQMAAQDSNPYPHIEDYQKANSSFENCSDDTLSMSDNETHQLFEDETRQINVKAISESFRLQNFILNNSGTCSILLTMSKKNQSDLLRDESFRAVKKRQSQKNLNYKPDSNIKRLSTRQPPRKEPIPRRLPQLRKTKLEVIYMTKSISKLLPGWERLVDIRRGSIQYHPVSRTSSQSRQVRPKTKTSTKQVSVQQSIETYVAEMLKQKADLKPDELMKGGFSTKVTMPRSTEPLVTSSSQRNSFMDVSITSKGSRGPGQAENTAQLVKITELSESSRGSDLRKPIQRDSPEKRMMPNSSSSQSFSRSPVCRSPAPIFSQNDFLKHCLNIQKERMEPALSQGESELLEVKVFQPYFISHSTIIEYQQQMKARASESSLANPGVESCTSQRIDFLERLSILQILENNYLQQNKQAVTRLYFRVNLNDLFTTENNTPECSPNQQHINGKIQEENSEDSVSMPDEEVQPIRMDRWTRTKTMTIQDLPEGRSPVYQQRLNFYKESRRNSSLNSDHSSLMKKYRSSPFENNFNPETILEDSSSSGESKFSQFYESNIKKRSTGNSTEESIHYFEFEIKKIDSVPGLNTCSNLILLNIKDVTSLVKNQQRFSDLIYLSAIENNYSHEQMTPLNSILPNSSLIKGRLTAFLAWQTGLQFTNEDLQACEPYFGHMSDLEKRLQEESLQAKENLNLMKSIEQSAKAMLYFNQNQIYRMKVRSNRRFKVCVKGSNAFKSILKVLWPFEHQIQMRRINVFIFKKHPFDFEVRTDWKLFELILFNIIQNAVKHNKRTDGELCIMLSCKPIKRRHRFRQNQYPAGYDKEVTHVLETEVIDTGLGVPPHQQTTLFVPFLELKNRLGLLQERSQSQNIGLGLSCSYDIVTYLKGDIKLKQTQPGLSVFAFKLPVSIKDVHAKASMKRPSAVNVPGITSESSSSPRNSMESSSSTGEKDIYQFLQHQKPISHLLSNYFETNGVQARMKVNRRLTNTGLGASFNSSPVLPRKKINSQRDPKKTQSRRHEGSQQDRRELKQKLNQEMDIHSNRSHHILPKIGFQEQMAGANLELRTQSFLDDQSPNYLSSNSGVGSGWDSTSEGLINILNSNRNPQKASKLKTGGKFDLNEIQEIVHLDDESSDYEILGRIPKHKSKSNSFYLLRSQPNSSNSIELHDAPELDVPRKETSSIKQKSSSQFKNTSNILLSEEQSSDGYRDLKSSSGMSSQKLDIVSEEEYSPPEKSEVLLPKVKLNLSLSFSRANQHVIRGSVSKSDSSSISGGALKARSPQRFIRSSSKASKIQEGSGSSRKQISIKKHFAEDHYLNLEGEEFRDNGSSSGYITISNYDPRKTDNDMSSISVNDRSNTRSNRSPSLGKQFIKGKERVVILKDSDDNLNSASHHLGRDIDPKFELWKVAPMKKMASLQRHLPQEERKLSVRRIPAGSSGQSKKNKSSNKSPSKADPDPDNSDTMSVRSNSGSSVSSEGERASQTLAVLPSILTQGQKFLPGQRTSAKRMLQHRGSMFDIQIEEAKTPDQHSLPCGCTAKILIVDDNEFNLFTLRTMLKENFNIVPDEAQNGKIAVEMFRQEFQRPCKCSNRGYKLIIMDIQMPEMNGIEATENIMQIIHSSSRRSQSSTCCLPMDLISATGPDIPDKKRPSHKARLMKQRVKNRNNRSLDICHIVALTAFTSDEQMAQCSSVGMKKVLSKPLNSKALKETMQLYYFRLSKEQIKARQKEKLTKALGSRDNIKTLSKGQMSANTSFDC